LLSNGFCTQVEPFGRRIPMVVPTAGELAVEEVMQMQSARKVSGRTSLKSSEPSSAVPTPHSGSSLQAPLRQVSALFRVATAGGLLSREVMMQSAWKTLWAAT
jgi:hypothetical protein